MFSHLQEWNNPVLIVDDDYHILVFKNVLLRYCTQYNITRYLIANIIYKMNSNSVSIKNCF